MVHGATSLAWFTGLSLSKLLTSHHVSLDKIPIYIYLSVPMFSLGRERSERWLRVTSVSQV
jgi:hypothetical protein